VFGERSGLQKASFVGVFFSPVFFATSVVDAPDQLEKVSAVTGLGESAVDEPFVETVEHVGGDGVPVGCLEALQVGGQSVGIV